LADIKKILDISVPEEWEDLAPPSMEEIQAWGRKLVPVAEPNLIYIARSEGQPIGFSIALPDYNQVLIHMKGKWLPFGFIKYLLHKSKIKGGRIFILFVVPEFRKKGVTAAIYYKSMSWAQQRGYIYGEGSTIGETNLAMRRDAERVGGVHYKTYRIYQYSIGQ
jgi:GNAT superfamily N-acetyltransferase